MAILELASVIISPITGLIGGALQRKHERDLFGKETDRIIAQNSHIEKQTELEFKLTELQGKLNAQQGEREIALADMEGSIDILKAGIEAEATLSNIKWGQSVLGDIANFARAMIRPTTTIYLLAAVSIYAAYELFSHGLNEENRILMLAMINSFEMTLAFWFASRPGHNRSSYDDGVYSRKSV